MMSFNNNSAGQNLNENQGQAEQSQAINPKNALLISSAAGYIDHWRKKLTDNHKWVVSAASQGQKAATYIENVEVQHVDK